MAHDKQPMEHKGSATPLASPDQLREKLRSLKQEALAPEQLASVHQAIATWRGEPGGLLPMLHAVQDALGYVPAQAVPLMAQALNLSRAEVHGVVSYYHHFRDHRPARHVVQVCRAEACKSMGADALLAHAEVHLACKQHESTADGQFTLEPVFCLGLCSSSPAMMLGDQLHARVTPARFDVLISKARSTT